MVELLVGVWHNRVDKPQMKPVLRKCLQILRELKQGDSVGLELSPKELNYYAMAFDALKDRSEKKIADLMALELAQLSPEERANAKLPSPAEARRRLRTVMAKKFFFRLYAAARHKKLAVVPLDSDVAKRYSIRQHEQLERHVVELINAYGFFGHSSLDEELRLKVSYAKLALRDKAMLTRLRRYNPTVAFLGESHVQNLQTHYKAVLARLGISSEKIRVHRPVSVGSWSMAIDPGIDDPAARKKFMAREERRLPRSFRKKRK